MKKKITLLLSLLLISQHILPRKHAISIEEYALCTIASITTLSGLTLIRKATKKKGTKKQGIAGGALTLSGIMLLLLGPRKVRMIHEQNNTRFSWNTCGREKRRQLIFNALDTQIKEENKKREPDTLMLFQLKCLQKIIHYDPLNLVVDNISWKMVIKEGIKETARNSPWFKRLRPS